MNPHIAIALSFTAALLTVSVSALPARRVVVFRSGQPALNADQTVIILWDAANKTEHFIRQASFKGERTTSASSSPRRRSRNWRKRGIKRFPTWGN